MIESGIPPRLPSPGLIAERACPDCGAQDVARAWSTVEPVPCPPCRFARAKRWAAAAPRGCWRCAFCEREVARPWRRKHLLGDIHKSHVRSFVALGVVEPAAVVAFEKTQKLALAEGVTA